MTTLTAWRRCSSCKAEIGFNKAYWVCSVSTCTRTRTGFFFCSVPCWEAHLPMMRHREAFAVEQRSPTAAQWEQQLRDNPEDDDGEPTPPRAAASDPFRAAPSAIEQRRPPDKPPAPAPAPPRAPAPAPPSPAVAPRRVVASPATADADDRDILIVVSKLKKYIRDRSGMNTSDEVMAKLSDHVRWIAELCIQAARDAGRKTVLDRDVPPVPRR